MNISAVLLEFLQNLRMKNREDEHMTEFFRMTAGHKYWDETITLAKNCSWKAGPFLAKIMKVNAFKEWERVIVACVNKKVVGFCTFMEKDELPSEYDFTPFIGFVFVREENRGKRLSEQLINDAMEYAADLGKKEVYIMSGEVDLYEKFGFKKLGDYKTIYGSTDQLFVKSTSL